MNLLGIIVRLAILAVIGLTPLSVRAQGAKPRATAKSANARFDALAKRASAAREADRLEEAIALYLQALKLKPKWSEGWWYVGSMFYERDQYAEARDAFQNLAVVDPKFPPAWSMMGLCEFRLKEYEAALGEAASH